MAAQPEVFWGGLVAMLALVALVALIGFDTFWEE